MTKPGAIFARGGNVKQSPFRPVLKDIHFWVPFLVLIFGLILLVYIR